MRLPRLWGWEGEYEGSLLFWYCETPDHSLLGAELGERGPERPFMFRVCSVASFEVESPDCYQICAAAVEQEADGE